MAKKAKRIVSPRILAGEVPTRNTLKVREAIARKAQGMRSGKKYSLPRTTPDLARATVIACPELAPEIVADLVAEINAASSGPVAVKRAATKKWAEVDKMSAGILAESPSFQRKDAAFRISKELGLDYEAVLRRLKDTTPGRKYRKPRK